MEKLENRLRNFTGTTRYYRAAFNNLLFTDGIKYLADQTGCYWLIDLIASWQGKVKDCPFQVWELNVFKDKSAMVTMQEDSDQPHMVKQNIPMTDFPLEYMKLYVEDGVLLLPGEH